MTPANQLLESLSVLRRQWRQRVVLESAAWIAGSVLTAIVLGQVIAAALGGSPSGVLVMRVVAYAIILAAVIRFLVLPLARRTTEERFALYVEERAPELRQALLSAVHELRAPESERASPSLAARLFDRAVAVMRPLQETAALERPKMLRALKALGAVALVGLMLFLVGPKALRHTARTLFAPWSVAEAATPVIAVRVLPGNAAIPRGAAVDIRASVIGFASDGAELVFRADSASEWVRIPMSRDSAAGGFTSRIFDLTRATEYYVDANGIRSANYRLTVTDLPAMKKLAVDLDFPAYTGMPREHIDDGGDVAAVVGTLATVHATITKPVRSGTLAFDNGQKVPLTLAKDGSMAATFRITHTGYYRVDLVSIDGDAVPGSVQYAVEALADRAPTVTIESPGRDTKVTSVDEVTIAARASDDYGVTSMDLHYRVNGGAEKVVALADSGKKTAAEARGVYTLFLEELKLNVGDLIAYYATAHDGAGNKGSSDVYFLEVRPLNKNYRQAEQGGAGGQQGDSPDGFVARQREVVAGTFNWLRDSATTSDRKRREDMATLNIAEGRLREEVRQLSEQITRRKAAQTDTNFTVIRAELDTAAGLLQAAEEQLVKTRGTDAMTPEQTALQHLQRAEAVYRDVQVQMGGQQGGGGSKGSQKAEELADLFELQTDKLKNQYESVQEQSQQQAQKEVDQSLEKLKELAARQQQENERAQKMADALRDKMGRDQKGGGGGGGSQREMARQAEEEARRLERLAREQNNQDLANAAQQVQRAADAMKRAATGSPSQGKQALDDLNRTASGLESARASAMSNDVRRLAQQAKELEGREQRIAEDVKKLPSLTPQQTGDAVQKLNGEKDALSRDVGKLENDADRIARQGQREQPAAAGKLGNAADAIREQRIRDMIAFSKNVMRSGSSDYANTFEGHIGQNLADVSGRMQAAEAALTGEPATRQDAKTLDKARELVRGVESLRDRTAQAKQGDGRQAGQNGKPGDSQQRQGGQQGKNGQPGQNGQQGGGNQPGENGNGRQLGGDAKNVGSRSGAQVDPRQLSREFGLRRQNAEDLRKDLAKAGVDVSQLDKAIEQLGRLEAGQGYKTPEGLAQLEGDVLDNLKSVEFALFRKMNGGDRSPTLGGRAPVPEEYRAAVEEYYRALANAKKKDAPQH